MGRPPVPAHLKRDKRLVVMLADEEAEMLAALTKRKDTASLSEWVRDALVSGEKREIEIAAWRFWLEELSFFLGTSAVLTTDRILKTIEDLRTMDAKPHAFMARLLPWEMEDFQKRAFPIYEGVGLLILAKVRPNED